jgi:hypothetical protein
MKRSIHIVLIVLLAFSFIFTSCKKIPFDYRNKYWGDWNFHYTSCEWDNNGNIKNGTGDYKGSITYDKKEKEKILINFIDSITVTFGVDKAGNLSGCGVEGTFDSKKKLFFTYRGNACNGILGWGVNYAVTGEKIK